MTDRDILRSFGYDPDDPVPRDDEGQRIIPDKLLRRLARTPAVPESWLGPASRARKPPGDLTFNEVAVLVCRSNGLSQDEAAAVLVKSTETIQSQTKSARYKLQTVTTIHACCEAIRRGLIP